MQKQNVSNTERRGPHKSMHCKFCKPPGVTTPEKPTRAQMETKTKVHLLHEAADLRLCNIHNEPGFPKVESEACICVLEGDNACPKCAPDKNRPPPKKKVCRCPKGAKPHPSMFPVEQKKKKEVDEDDEFWWEKYSREHDALAKETWAAYMAQRRKDKKLAKCQKQEERALLANKTKGSPTWYQKLSCQQMLYVEFLSTAIRLDSDENITDRTLYVLGGIGLYPRPSRKILKKCLRYCHYNAIRFLNQLQLLIKEVDPFQEKPPPPSKNSEEVFTWNERLIMNTMCYLEFPALLRELMDRLPPLPRDTILPPIPYPVFRRISKKKYDSPYEEPIWQDRLNWIEKMKIDRINRCRTYLETKRIKIPFLALVRRPSLIDARPPFLAQIEANERASRRLAKQKVKKTGRKHPISTFNSAVDVTAIAGIEASEISTTDKADTEDICVFLRDPKGPESVPGEIEEESDFPLEKEVKFADQPTAVENPEVSCVKVSSHFADEEEDEEDGPDIPFKTPPKTMSGNTIASPCPPPLGTPGPPATHFDKAKRELDILNNEICGFYPFVSSSSQITKECETTKEENVELQLKSAAEKLKKLAGNEPSGKKKTKKKHKRKEKRGKRKKLKKSKPPKKPALIREPSSTEENIDPDKEEETEDEEEEENQSETLNFDDLKLDFKALREKTKQVSKRPSQISDPDPNPDTEDDWSTKFPCKTGATTDDELEKPNKKRKHKRKGKHSKKKKKSGKKIRLEEEKGNYKKKKPPGENTERGTTTESDEKEEKTEKDENEKEEEKKEVDVFRGDVEALVRDIIHDLEEEGFHCASYPYLSKHPEIDQLIMYLRGEIITQSVRKDLHQATKERWSFMKPLKKFFVPDLGLTPKRIKKADWNDKKWISKLAKAKIDQFYFRVAAQRAEHGKEIYETLYQSHFGTDRYLNIFYAYMVSKYEDAILRGIF